MALQASGQISLNNLQTQFGGTNPINFSEYYLNAATGYATGVSGIPNIGTQIALSNFYGKAKTVVASNYPPAAVQSTQSNFGNPWGFGSTSLEWLTGASGTNLTRTGGTTFNNLGSYGQNRTNFVNNQNLILQAKPGDALRFVIQNGAAYSSDYEVNSLLLHLDGGWFNVQSVGGSGGHTDTINYTLSASLAPGSYGIFAYNNYSSAGSASYASGNFYSLHVVA
jgi:hypothetical protein